MKKHLARLRHELQEVKNQIAALERSTSAKPDYGLGVGDPAITRWELDRALLRQLRGHMETVQHAISETRQGAFGVCENCGQPINPDRLAVLPEATTCITCARAAQRM